MSMLYILLLPLFSLVVYKKARDILYAKKHKDISKMKAEIFFMILIFMVSYGIIKLM